MEFQRSAESYRFRHGGYPEIDTIENKLKQIESAGYTAKGHFICPVTDWTVNYYDSIQKNLHSMGKKYAGNETALNAMAMLQAEIDIYRRYDDEFSYVFYALQKK